MNKRIRNPAYLKAFGEHLRKMRTAKGKSMAELADESEIAYTQVAKIELGQINTTISTIRVLAETLQVHPAEFFQFSYPSKTNKR